MNLLDLKIKKKALVIGKGPSFDKVGDLNLDDYFVCGMSQVVKYMKLDLWISAHVEPVIVCWEHRSNAKYLTMPYYPLYSEHSRMDQPIDTWPEITSMDNFLPYNAHWHKPEDDSKILQGFGTVAHHLVHALIFMGVKDITFAGVDGGLGAHGKTYYSDKFDHPPLRESDKGKAPTNYDSFIPYYFQLRRKYGLKYTWV